MTYTTGNRISTRRLIAASLCGVIASTAAAQPAPVAGAVDLNSEQRVLIAQLTADKAITVARERRIAAADQLTLCEQLKVKGQKVRAAERRASGNAARTAEVRKARDQIASERQALTTALADRDRISDFRATAARRRSLRVHAARSTARRVVTAIAWWAFCPASEHPVQHRVVAQLRSAGEPDPRWRQQGIIVVPAQASTQRSDNPPLWSRTGRRPAQPSAAFVPFPPPPMWAKLV